MCREGHANGGNLQWLSFCMEPLPGADLYWPVAYLLGW